MSKQVQNTLKSLFSSSVRAEVLALLLNNQDEKFYVREIATLLRKNPSGVKRELDNLEKMGILTSSRVANLKYFQAEKKSPLFSELKSLIAKSMGISGALKALLKSVQAVKVAFIYGPHAQNEESEVVDLFVAGPSSLSIDGIKEIEEKFLKKINVMVMEEPEFRSKKEKSDPELASILSGSIIMLTGKV